MNCLVRNFTEKHCPEIQDKASSAAPFKGYDKIDSNQKFSLL